MKIRIIKIRDGAPYRVTADLTVEELAWIARRAGEGASDRLGSDLYDATTGELFNRYWSDGLTGYLNGDETS